MNSFLPLRSSVERSKYKSFDRAQDKKESLFSKIKNKHLPLGLVLKIKRLKLNLIKLRQKLIKNLIFVFFLSRSKTKVLFGEAKLIYKKPTRYVSHLSIVAILFLVVFSELFSVSTSTGKTKESPSPVGFKLKSQSLKSDILDVKRVASVASALDPRVTDEAKDIANSTLSNMPTEGTKFLSKISPVKTTIPEGRLRDSVITYVVEPGDTLWSIAIQFDISKDTVKWANNIADENELKPGQTLKILPATGVLYAVADGDTLEGIASSFGSSAEKIIYQNDLEGKPIALGMEIMVPDGIIDEPEPEPEPAPSYPSYVASTPTYYSGGGNNFPWGYCTWWVANKRYIPWNGNAWEWYYNAQAMGYPTGGAPTVGAIYVSWESWVGHVGYVESVNGDGSYTISEMNYYGYGAVNTRTIGPGSVPLIGFVY